MDRQNPRVTDHPTSVAQDDPERRTQEIRAEIQQTRADLSETVNAIQDRMRPGTIASNAADRMKQAARERARDVAESDSIQYVRDNPVPTAMIAVGIAGVAWLATRNERSRRQSTRWRSHSTGEWRTSPYYAGDDYYRNDEESWNETTTPRRRERPERGQFALPGSVPNQLRRRWNNSPLLIGAAVALAGAVVGLTVPETERENELMGETRDNMIDTVQETVRTKVNQVQQAASNAATMVQDAAKTAVGIGETTSDEGQRNRS